MDEHRHSEMPLAAASATTSDDERWTRPAAPVPPAPALPTLHGRVGRVLTVLLALLMLIGAAVWARATHDAIGEEIRAASAVAQQWLSVLIAETRDDADGNARLMEHLRALGRVRANQLQVFDAAGALLYTSPPSPYKAGRAAPDWFARYIMPELAASEYAAGTLRIRMLPDASRATLDAWDDLMAALGWACALLVLVWFGSRIAIERALSPLRQINEALVRGADGVFDTRLPACRVSEIDLLARSYNRLAERLDNTRARNARLEEDQAFSRALNVRMEEERQIIARELHDELGQSITAVRAIAGAILQRSAQSPQIHGSAQAILAMTGQLQDGVRTILQRLRSGGAGSAARIEEVVRDYCTLWASHHHDITLECHIETLPRPLGEAHALAVLRLLQEALTNVARHANASRVEVALRPLDDGLELSVRDDGRGLRGASAPDRFGVLGMRERVDELAGELHFEAAPGGGLNVRARLPCFADGSRSR